MSFSRSSGTRRADLAKAASVVLAVGAGVVGIIVGRQVAYLWTSGEFGGLDAIIVTLVLGTTVVGLASIGLIARKIRHGQGSLAIGTILASAGLLALGALGGDATAAATGGLGPPVEVPTMSTGTLSVSVDPPIGAKVTRPATCDVGAGGWTIDATGDGLSGPHDVLRVIFYPSISPMVTLQLLGYAGSVPTGALVVDNSGATGSVRFTHLDVDPNAAGPRPSFLVVGGADYPTSLSGTVTWACNVPVPSP
jgi:hypothetical protein